jgi:pimeloyl-ACP methyl ester carboxylesterase
MIAYKDRSDRNSRHRQAIFSIIAIFPSEMSSVAAEAFDMSHQCSSTLDSSCGSIQLPNPFRIVNEWIRDTRLNPINHLIFPAPRPLLPELLSPGQYEPDTDMHYSDIYDFWYLAVAPDTGITAHTKVIVYFHGNAEDVSVNRSWACALAVQTNCLIFIPEYPGYGPTRGIQRADPYSISQVARSSILHLTREMGIDHRRIILVGRSIGTAPAIEAAASCAQVCGGVLLIAPFTSISDIARHLAGRLAGWIISKRFDNLSRICDIPAGCRVRIVHGTDDNLIPYQHSQALYARRQYGLPMTEKHNTELYLVANRNHQSILADDVSFIRMLKPLLNS